jgi:murein DD-endopeptidase MepM/ murein hydrolase activator NlpD
MADSNENEANLDLAADEEYEGAVYKKYALVEDDVRVLENGETVYRIQALDDFGYVNKGDLGGYVASEDNLSHDGASWVADEAIIESGTVSGNAIVSGNAVVKGETIISGDVQIAGDAVVIDSDLSGNVFVDGNEEIKNEFAQDNSDLGVTSSGLDASENVGGEGFQTSSEVLPFDQQAQQVQALLTLSGIDAGPIDGLEGPKTRGGMYEYAVQNGLDEDVSVSEIHTHMMARLESDPEFFETVKDAAIAAVVGNNDTPHNIKAAQSYFNAAGYTDDSGHALAVDGVAGEKTTQALSGLTEAIQMRNSAQEELAVFDTPDGEIVEEAVETLEENFTSDHSKLGPLEDSVAEFGTLTLGRPVDGEVISGYGKRSVESEALNRTVTNLHTGVDYAVKPGTEMVAQGDAKVIFAGKIKPENPDHYHEENNYDGKTVALDHGNGVVSVYTHLRNVKVDAGDTVVAGDVFGKTGRAKGAVDMDNPGVQCELYIQDRDGQYVAVDFEEAAGQNLADPSVQATLIESSERKAYSQGVDMNRTSTQFKNHIQPNITKTDEAISSTGHDNEWTSTTSYADEIDALLAQHDGSNSGYGMSVRGSVDSIKAEFEAAASSTAPEQTVDVKVESEVEISLPKESAPGMMGDGFKI